jgi:hypothetical protein
VLQASLPALDVYRPEAVQFAHWRMAEHERPMVACRFLQGALAYAIVEMFQVVVNRVTDSPAP